MRLSNKIKVIVYIIIFVSCQTSVFGQEIGYMGIDKTKVIKPWITKSVLEYQGVYGFGMSEWESELRLIITENGYYGQIKEGSFSKDGKKFFWYYTNLKNITIKGNKFFSKETNGEFIFYGDHTGLKVYKPWDEYLKKGGEYDIGTKNFVIEWAYSGKYPQASLRHLKKDELQTMSKAELEIMRNEIFARYGYIFSAGGEMERYFKRQDWYEGQHKNVSNFLTDLEKRNIKLIKQIEKGYEEK
jgi:hypothetical protein